MNELDDENERKVVDLEKWVKFGYRLFVAAFLRINAHYECGTCWSRQLRKIRLLSNPKTKCTYCESKNVFPFKVNWMLSD